MNLSELVSGGIGNQAVEGISQQLGIEKEKTQWVVSAAVPLMMSSLNYNANKNPEAAANIQALASKHEGSIFDNLGSLFNSAPTQDENQIVDHIFGKNTDQVKNSLAEKSGLSSDKVAGILALLGPLIMGFIGKQRQGANSGGGIGDLLGGILKKDSPSTESSGGLGDLIGSVLGGGEKSDSGSMTNGIGDLASEFFTQGKDDQSKGNILDSLAGVFGKK
ncbi:MAG: DUF937 domain-containing protein [Sphingobacteriaceae bacterium]